MLHGSLGHGPYSTDVPRKTQGTEPFRILKLDWVSVIIPLVAVTATASVIALLHRTPQTISTFAVALLIALGLDHLVVRVEKKLKLSRGLAVGLVMTSVVILGTLVITLVVPPAVDQARSLSDELPSIVSGLAKLPIVGNIVNKDELNNKVQDWLRRLPDELGTDASPIADLASQIGRGLLSMAMVIVLTIAMLLDGRRVVASLVRLIPARQRPLVQRGLDVMYKTVGHYVAGSLFVAILAGTVNLTIGLSFGVPLAPLLAIWVLVTNLIPQVGGFLGGIPFVVLSFTVSPLTGLICLGIFLAYLQLENHVIQPLVIGRAVSLSPIATMIAAIVGGAAFGVVGALLATPVVGACKAFYLELRPLVPESEINILTKDSFPTELVTE